ncbi:hypothetical protein X975_04605, partial [Stegodyphus mimosarum]
MDAVQVDDLLLTSVSLLAGAKEGVELLASGDLINKALIIQASFLNPLQNSSRLSFPSLSVSSFVKSWSTRCCAASLSAVSPSFPCILWMARTMSNISSLVTYPSLSKSYKLKAQLSFSSIVPLVVMDMAKMNSLNVITPFLSMSKTLKT